jgi:hypothetical protein
MTIALAVYSDSVARGHFQAHDEFISSKYVGKPMLPSMNSAWQIFTRSI